MALASSSSASAITGSSFSRSISASEPKGPFYFPFSPPLHVCAFIVQLSLLTRKRGDEWELISSLCSITFVNSSYGSYHFVKQCLFVLF